MNASSDERATDFFRVDVGNFPVGMRKGIVQKLERHKENFPQEDQINIDQCRREARELLRS